MTILFHTHADAVVGVGHLMRCCSLAAAFDRLADVSCHFEASALGLARAILAATGTDADLGSGDVLHDIVVADVGSLDADGVKSLRSSGRMIVSVEDRPRAMSEADIVVQPNLMPLVSPAGARAFFGGREFILLHPAYADGNPGPIAPSVRRVLMCFGGSDPANLSLRLARLTVDFRREAEYRLVIGPHYRWAGELVASALSIPGLSILHGKGTLADEMAICDLAIVSGGTLAYEACALGRPTVVVSQNDEQAGEAAILGMAGAVVDLGQHDRVSDDGILVAIRGLWDDPERRRSLGAKATVLVPRDGAMRAAAAILRQVDETWASTSVPFGAGA